MGCLYDYYKNNGMGETGKTCEEKRVYSTDQHFDVEGGECGE